MPHDLPLAYALPPLWFVPVVCIGGALVALPLGLVVMFLHDWNRYRKRPRPGMFVLLAFSIIASACILYLAYGVWT